MEKLRVIQLITGLGPGGAERLVLDMVTRFDPARFDVKLVSIADDLRALEVFGHERVPVTTFDLSRAGGFVGAWQLGGFVRTFRPHVIHAHMFHSLVAAIVACRCQGQHPAICFTSHRSKYSRARASIVRALRNTRAVDIIFEADQHPEMNAHRTAVIANGVAVPPVRPRRAAWLRGGPVKFLFVGRLSPPKDPIGLLRSFAAAGIPEATLDIVGSGPLESAARAAAHTLGIADKVRFHGIRSDVRSTMEGADVLVMHSATEGMPMAILEAGAQAMPVVSTPVGSIPRLLAGERGWTASVDAFPAILRDVANDPGRAILAGGHLYDHVLANHSIDGVVAAHEGLYESLAPLRSLFGSDAAR